MRRENLRDGVDFQTIRPLGGSRAEGFEEFCCQIARRTPDVPVGSNFLRYRGAGGDGGVECVWRLPDGSEWGWQAKHFFEFGAAQRHQLTESVETALTIHPALTRYTVCLPFDLTGPTGRRGTRQTETYEALEGEWLAKARASGIEIEFRRLGKSELLDGLLAIDPAGARRRFWFDDQLLTPEWFGRHLRDAAAAAYPRYTPELSVAVPLASSFEALGRTAVWEETDRHRLDDLRAARSRWTNGRAADAPDGTDPDFPDAVRCEVDELDARLEALVDLLPEVRHANGLTDLEQLVEEARAAAARCEALLVQDLERRHFPGAAESASFRQFQAEIGRAYPTLHVDAVRELRRNLDAHAEWLRSPDARLPAAPAMLVLGAAGSGKTHAMCDAALDRNRRGLRSVVVFGQHLHEGEPWAQIGALLGLGAGLPRDELLGMLDVAAESTGFPLIVFVDALNETNPRSVWQRFLAQMVEQVDRYEWLKLCLSCRTSYRDVTVPAALAVPEVEHRGFEGVEFEALLPFFAHYGIEAPAAPLLQPEYANPLFLRLVCEGLGDYDLRRIPDAQLSFDEVVRLFLDSKNARISAALDQFPQDHLVPRVMDALAAAMAEGATRELSWEEARAIVDAIGPNGPRSQSLFGYLLGEGLLVEDRVVRPEDIGVRDVVRFAFDRLADFLVAERHLADLAPDSVLDAFGPTGRLRFAVRDRHDLATHRGLLEALAILLPERFGLEITAVPAADGLEWDLRSVLCSSLTWRSPTSVSVRTASELEGALSTGPLFAQAMDTLLALGARSGHPLNADWGHGILARIPMPDRDAVLCPYLHFAWGVRGGVDRLVRWALEAKLEGLAAETARLWATQLAWFLASNDRRVRDHATKAIVRILDRHPGHCAPLLTRFLRVDDDYIVERCLAACYGALLRRRDRDAIRASATVLWQHWFQPGQLRQNALIRDYARLIMELALDVGVLPATAAPEAFRPPYDSEWPPAWPSETDIERYKEQDDVFPRLYWSCLEDDFFRYTIVGTFGLRKELPPVSAGAWILQHVVDMGYTPERFAGFDSEMIRTYGSGRGRPEWAERIGKKYQWIALYRLKALAADHLESGDAASDPEVLADAPLQAVGQRNIDPSHWLTPSVATEPSYPDLAPDFAAANQLSDEEWLRQSVLPDTLSLLLTPRPCQGTLVLPMSANFRFQSKPAEEVIRGDAFRELAIHLSSYLVPTQGLKAFLARLNEVRIGLHSPPEAESLNPTFLGEYPTTVEARRTLALQAWHPDSLGYVPGLMPAEYRIVNDFELDAFTGKALSIHVPAPVFFERTRLEWDGSTGFLAADGRPAFLNPSTDGWDPVSFAVAFDYLRGFLRESQHCALWLEQVRRTAIAEEPPGRLYIDIVRCHVFDGETVDTVIERTTDAQLVDPGSNGDGQDDAEE